MPGINRNRNSYVKCRGLFSLLAAIAMAIALSGCGGSSSSASSGGGASLSGNWQFSIAKPSGYPADAPYYGLLGGFLLESNGSLTGQAVYSISNTDQNNQTVVCNAGTATLTASTINGTTVSLTYVAGSPTDNITFTLSGTLTPNANGPATIQGDPTNSSSTVVTPSGATPCGAAVSALSWSAMSVPPLTGSISGSFHSVATSPDLQSLQNRDFPVTGALAQGANIGASNATVTGTLSFIDPITGLNNYPCIPGGVVSLNGEISGNTVILQLLGLDGSDDGQIGVPLSQQNLGGDGLYAVIFDSTTSGYLLQAKNGTADGLGYLVNSKPCPAVAPNGNDDNDTGYICLALNSPAGCQEPISLSPATITFPALTLNAMPYPTQTITLANNSSSTLHGLTLNFKNNPGGSFNGGSDFDALFDFGWTDACGAGGAPAQGKPFDLASGQSCSITVTFTPQESCPWLPFVISGEGPSLDGAPPQYCPIPLSATLKVLSPSSADGDTSFSVPITGIGLSALQPSTAELDFSAEEQFAPQEASLPQTVSFTNTSANPVQILGSVPCLNPPNPGAALTLPYPRQNSPVAGLQVLENGNGNVNISPDTNTVPYTVTYRCDSDPGTQPPTPNFQISSDTCTGNTIAPQASCSLRITYVPQPTTHIGNGLDYFLELNTLQCWANGGPTPPSDNNPCETDSGRFPVELKANAPSPLRMSPSAGLDFGTQTKGTTSAPLTITLLNDPTLTTTETVTFESKIQVSGSYVESDDCPAVLNSGDSCTLTVTFDPSGTGFSPGSLAINYTQQPSGGVATLGNPQKIYLRGTGQ